MKVLKITQVKSSIGSIGRHKDTVRTLGLRKIGQSVYHNDTPQMRGMIASIAHLVRWEAVDSKPDAKKKPTKTGYKVIHSKPAK